MCERGIRLRAFPYPISRFLTTPLLGHAGSFASMTSDVHVAAPDGVQDEARLPITVVLAGDHAKFRQTIRRLRTQMPWTEIVVLTSEESALLAQQLLAAGAAAFVFKE